MKQKMSRRWLALAVVLVTMILPGLSFAAGDKTFDVGTEQELCDAMAEINRQETGAHYIINLTADFTIGDILGDTGNKVNSEPNNAFRHNTTTIYGNGHTLTHKGSAEACMFLVGNINTGDISAIATLNLGSKNEPEKSKLTITNDDKGKNEFFVVDNGSTLNMYPGVVMKNGKVGGAGWVSAVRVGNSPDTDNTGTFFNMYGGTIAGGRNEEGCFQGAIGIMTGAVFNMYDGEIKDNISAEYGGGVLNWMGTFNMHGGLIEYNSAMIGGGVLNLEGSFQMTGGIIRNNTARICADDVYTQNGSCNLIKAKGFGILDCDGIAIDGWYNDGLESGELRWGSAIDDDNNGVDDGSGNILKPDGNGMFDFGAMGTFSKDDPFISPFDVTSEITNGGYALKAAHGFLYTVTYTDGVDDEVIFEDQVTPDLSAGVATPAFTGTPYREGYEFLGWDPAVSPLVEGDAIYTAQWKELSAISIIPANVTGYVGGLSASGNSAPTMRFRLVIGEGASAQPLTKLDDWTLTMHLTGKTVTHGNHTNDTQWEMAPIKVSSGSNYYLLPTLELGLDRDEQTHENHITGEFLKLTHVEKTNQAAGHYKIELVDENNWHITATNNKTGSTYNVEVHPEQVQIISRFVHDEKQTYEEPSSMLSKVVTDDGKVNTLPKDANGKVHRKVVAVIPAGATFYTNGEKSGLGILGAYGHGYQEDKTHAEGNPLIALLFDETVSLTDEATDAVIEESMKNYARSSKGYSFDGWNYRFRYLDLVNVNDGNAWVSCDKDITIYWPYPEEILSKIDAGMSWNEAAAEYDFQILHFSGMEREYWNQVKCTVEKVNVVPTDKGLRFVLPCDKEGGNMSPFALMWKLSPDAPSVDVPKTGDISHTGTWCVMLLLAAAALAVLLVRKKE